MRREILTIQYLRAVAVLLVVYVHALEQFDWLKPIFHAHAGHAGVDLFFVISGFIMVYSTHGKPIGGLTFFWHRILRIVPLYWFFTISLVIVAYLLPSVVESVKLTASAIFGSLFFIPMHSTVYPERFWPVLIPGWTLNYEMAFYLLFALSLFLKDRFRIPFLAVVMVGMVVFGPYLAGGTNFQFYTDLIILEFLMGVILGYLFVHDKLRKQTLLGSVLMVAGVAYFFMIQGHVSGSRFYDAGVAATIIVLGALLIDHSKRPEIKWLHTLGNASYSIYLSHVFALGFYRFIRDAVGVAYSQTAFNGVILVAVAILFSAMVGVAVYYLIEMPINQKLRKKPH